MSLSWCWGKVEFVFEDLTGLEDLLGLIPFYNPNQNHPMIIHFGLKT